MWEAALVSAAVALLVTLLLEYGGKPWLDARKERILESHRHAREIQGLVAELKADIFRYKAWGTRRSSRVNAAAEDEVTGVVNEKLAAIAEDELTAIVASARQRSQRLSELLNREHLPISQVQRAALHRLARYAWLWLLALRSGVSHRQLLEDHIEKLIDATGMVYLTRDLPWWKTRQRRQWRKLIERLDSVDFDEEPAR
jgi:tRNA A37 N6-isopentenylltransferase MiaA